MREGSPLPTPILKQMRSASKWANATERGRFSLGARRLSVRNKCRSARACPNPWSASSTRRQENSDKLAVNSFVVE